VPTIYAYLLHPTYLKRKIFTTNGINVVYNNITDHISMSVNDSYQAVNTEGRRIEALKQRIQSKGTGVFTIGDIEQYLYDETVDKTKTVKIEAALLYSIFEKTFEINVNGNIITTADCKAQFTPVGPIVFEDPKPACTKITTPLVSQPGLFPTKSINSELSAIAGRITKIKNVTLPPKHYSTYAREFVKLVVPQPHQGHPWTMEDVIKEQSRPLQRSRTARVLSFLGVQAPNRLKTFNKAESYPAINEPRIITTCDPRLTLEMSRFTYAFKNSILKMYQWYGPGKTPTKSVSILQKLVTDGSIETDFTRFDGSISKWLQERIVFESYLRWVNISEKDLMLHYLRQVFVKKGKTTTGIKYSAGWGTRSGSPITTDANTMINAFISYAALRELGLDEQDAWNNLGIYAGDDGINKVLNGFKDSIEQVCSDLGLDVKIKLTGRNEPTSYLSRIFPAPLSHVDSFQDPMRTLSKLHLSANKNVTREQAAVNKAIGYLTTDEKTPIISQYCKKVIEITGLAPKHLLTEEIRKIENGAWPQNNQQFITESFCKHMNINQGELDIKINLISSAKSLDDFPILINNQVEHKLDALVGDNLVITRPRFNEKSQWENHRETENKEKWKPTNSNTTSHARVRNAELNEQRNVKVQKKALPSKCLQKNQPMHTLPSKSPPRCSSTTKYSSTSNQSCKPKKINLQQQGSKSTSPVTK
jgi:hypothetical protein